MATILLSNVLVVALVGLFSVTSGKFHDRILITNNAFPTLQGNFSTPAADMYFILDELLSNNRTRSDTLTWTTDEYYIIPLLPTATPPGLEEYNVTTLGIGVDIQCAIVEVNNITNSCDPQSESRTCLTPGYELSYSNQITIDDPCWSENSARSRPGSYRWPGPRRDFILPSANCIDTLFILWLEQPGNPHPQMNQLRQKLDIYQDYLEELILKCSVVDKVVVLDVTVNAEKQVLSTSHIRSLTGRELAELYPRLRTTSLAFGFFDQIATGLWTDQLDPKSNLQWLNFLIATVEPKTIRLLINETRIPNATYIASGFEDIYRRLFAINLKLYANDIIGQGEQLQPVLQPAIVIVDRVAMNTNMFVIAVSILGIMIVVLVSLYWSQRQLVGHQPSTLAGMYALLYASNAKRDFGQIEGRTPKQRARRLEELGGLYAFGHFVSEGGTHHGVYRKESKREMED